MRIDVRFDEILLDLGPDVLEQIPEVTDEGEISQNRAFRLQYVVQAEQGERAEHHE